MLRQTLEKYKSIKMGDGEGSIYSYGCYLVSLVDGLVTKGYIFTPEGFNEILKSKSLWTGEFLNYIDVDNIATKYPEIFISFAKHDVWPSNDQLNTWLDNNFIVVCKVDARGIGGSGTHFVVLKEMQGSTAIIGDPWFGDIKPVTLRYGKLGNILSLRVFEIVPSNQESMSLSTALTHFRVKNEQELISMVDEQLKFLDEERAKTAGLEKTIKGLTADHANFLEQLIGLMNSFGNPLGLSSEKLVIQNITELVASTSELQSKLTAQEKASAKAEQVLKDNNLALQKQLDTVQLQFNKLKLDHAEELKVMQERIDKIQAGVDTNNEKKDELSKLTALLQPIINIVKGWYGKTK